MRSSRRHPPLLFLGPLLVIPFMLSAGPQSESPADSGQVGMLLAQANDFAQKYFDNEKALELYSEALALESQNSEILWRISRAYIDIGEHLPSVTDDEKNKQLEMYEKAVEFANRSVEIDPGSSMAYARRGIAVGRVSRFKGLWESVGLLKDVRTDLDRAISLDSTNDVAYFALGRTHIKVLEKPWILRWPLGLGWGSRKDAVEMFERAVALKSDFIPYHLACAKVYAEEEEYEKARAHLILIPSLATQDEDDEQCRREAKELFDKIRSEE